MATELVRDAAWEMKMEITFHENYESGKSLNKSGACAVGGNGQT